TSIEKWLEGFKDDSWTGDVMLLYMASSYKNMKAKEKAKTWLDRFDEKKVAKGDYRFGVYDEAIRRTAHLYLISKHFPTQVKSFDGSKMKSLVDSLSKNYNTTSSALSILAFEAYSKVVKAENMQGIKVKEALEAGQELLALNGKLFPKANFSSQAKKLMVENSSGSTAYYAVTQAGFENSPLKEALSQKIEVFREFLNEAGEKVSKAKIGEELTVQIRSRVIDGDYASQVAVVDLLPGGFEVIIDSLDRDSMDGSYMDAREDRVLLFRNFTDKVQTYTYRIKAINKGEYEVPPIYAESMYDQTVKAHGTSGKITDE
ncbi:MAG: hypothetical protein MJK18_15450, partial [Bdellovibrionales bacterium]|nr:hypothetical protein [Bdellovibrionales bacterium]